MPGIARIRDTAKRITLVNATAEHAQLLYDIFTGNAVRKYSPVSRTSVAELALRLAQGGRAFSGKAPFYRVFGSVEGALFGTFILKTIDWEKGDGEVGFSLLDAWQGRGLGSALVAKCVAKLFEETALESVWATVSVTNEAANKLMRHIGFSDCGLHHEAFPVNGEAVRQTVYRMHRAQAGELVAES